MIDPTTPTDGQIHQFGPLGVVFIVEFILDSDFVFIFEISCMSCSIVFEFGWVMDWFCVSIYGKG